MPKSRVSHGWLAVFTLVQIVLVTLFGISLGLVLTLGTPKLVRTQLTSGQSRQAIAHALNDTLLAAAQAGGLTVASNTQVATPALTAKLTGQLVDAAADFHTNVSLAETKAAIHQRLRAAAAPAHTKPTEAQWQLIDRRVDAALTKSVNDIMTTGVGTAYGIVVLTLQTMTIVCGILGVIVMGLMRIAAHSWRRFLRVFGRVCYVVGFLGGAAALVAAMPQVTAQIRMAAAPAGVVGQLVKAFAPTWQHVAGGVIVVGLLLVGSSYLLSDKTIYK
ncbi:hypothetical protein [Lacticaseibacillus jixiensis]|uniref:hypothetical protein n=1 Tax=Lacticaseibacillus jixiensis TaxID=3231926 RepID=UPI0036F4260B